MFPSKVRMLSLGMVAAVALLLASSRSAQAQSPGIAMVKLTNNTNYVITYSVAWGNGGWQTFTLAPGQALNHYYTSSTAPTMNVFFDRGFGRGTVTVATVGWLVPNTTSNGNPYQFLMADDGAIYLFVGG